MDKQEIDSAEGEGSMDGVEGLICPICMEGWTAAGGEHQVCCLPCGHIYGLSCIKSWLIQGSGECPQCKSEYKLNDIRPLYASRIVGVDHKLHQQIQSLEFLCASLEEKEQRLRNRVQCLESECAALKDRVRVAELGSAALKDECAALKDRVRFAELGRKVVVPVAGFASALAIATPEEQRTMLREILYPLVDQLEHEHAGIVTGMLLKMDTTKVIYLLESPEALKAKVAQLMDLARSFRARAQPINLPH